MNEDKIRFRSFILDTKNALTQLEGCGYLDDSILDFFLGFIKEFCISHNNYTWNIFSTLFNVLLSKCSKKEEYINMRRWIKRLTFPLLLHDFILIPIHSNTCHWWILIICFPKKGIKIIKDSNKDKHINILNEYNENNECILKSSIGWIICLDSLGYTNVKKSEKQATIINILKFLNIEYNYNNEYENMRRDGFIFSENISNDWYIIYNPYNIPNQYNGYDCGLRISLKLIIIKIRDNPDWIYNMKIKQEILSIFDNGLEIKYNNNELKYLTYFSNSHQDNYNSELYIPNNSGPISSFLANKLDILSNRLNKYKRDS
ncbi:Ulp1 protease family, C-terminal catalytic domain-containing protein [Cryptosporidium muris RN66]|uniref:Ulp1 protease family, C-terminal catalytic domain-containing protein n=1 Tax=Cryptosporidium muris (strain RN66) TaxID=441375 RepID=B6AAD0_CRYMR|nr:Ulp1 protease family, C-terminal catalytic domain-containing protein [Cryptosporidium muris RN66]EEA05171.1 Ulp1 protease family, C-terminal catalytic domain-containing protein [Cryptosporidium muris RN66]|eukprot:XP_002139520.1 Ulp1 protease family, C-terminal catalytic domain-containing protein [Cryptosporidium muris RN66]